MWNALNNAMKNVQDKLDSMIDEQFDEENSGSNNLQGSLSDGSKEPQISSIDVQSDDPRHHNRSLKGSKAKPRSTLTTKTPPSSSDVDFEAMLNEGESPDVKPPLSSNSETSSPEVVERLERSSRGLGKARTEDKGRIVKTSAPVTPKDSVPESDSTIPVDLARRMNEKVRFSETTKGLIRAAHGQEAILGQALLIEWERCVSEYQDTIEVLGSKAQSLEIFQKEIGAQNETIASYKAQLKELEEKNSRQEAALVQSEASSETKLSKLKLQAKAKIKALQQKLTELGHGNESSLDDSHLSDTSEKKQPETPSSPLAPDTTSNLKELETTLSDLLKKNAELVQANEELAVCKAALQEKCEFLGQQMLSSDDITSAIIAEKALLEQEKASLASEKAALENDIAQLNESQVLLGKEILTLQKENQALKQQTATQTATVTSLESEKVRLLLEIEDVKSAETKEQSSLMAAKEALDKTVATLISENKGLKENVYQLNEIIASQKHELAQLTATLPLSTVVETSENNPEELKLMTKGGLTFGLVEEDEVASTFEFTEEPLQRTPIEEATKYLLSLDPQGHPPYDSIIHELLSEINSLQRKIVSIENQLVHERIAALALEDLISQQRGSFEDASKVADESIALLTESLRKAESELLVTSNSSQDAKAQLSSKSVELFQLSLKYKAFESELEKAKETELSLLDQLAAAQSDYVTAQEEVKRSQIAIDNLEKTLTVSQEKIEAQLQDLEKYGEQVSDLQKEKATMEKTTTDLKTCKGKLKLLEGKLKAKEEEALSKDLSTAQLQAEIVALKTALSSSDDSNTSTLVALKTELTQKETLISDLKTEYDSIMTKNEALVSELQQKDKEIDEAHGVSSALETQMKEIASTYKQSSEHLGSEVSRLNLQVKSLESQLDLQEQQLLKTHNDLVERENRVTDLISQISSLEHTLQQSETQLLNVTHEDQKTLSDTSSKLQQLELQYAEKVEELVETKDKIELLERSLISKEDQFVECSKKNVVLEEALSALQVSSAQQLSNLELKVDQLKVECRLAQEELANVVAAKSQADAELQRLTVSLQDEDTELGFLRGEIEELKNRLQSNELSFNETLSAEKAKIATLESELEIKLSAFLDSEKKCASLTSRVEAQEATILESNARLVQFGEEMRIKAELMEKTQQLLDFSQQHIHELEANEQHHLDESEAREKELISLRDSETTLLSDIAGLKASVESLEYQNTVLQSENAKAQMSLSDMTSSSQRISSEKDSLLKQLASAKQSHEDVVAPLKVEIEALKKSIEDERVKQATTQSELDVAHEELSRLQGEIANFRRSQEDLLETQATEKAELQKRLDDMVLRAKNSEDSAAVFRNQLEKQLVSHQNALTEKEGEISDKDATLTLMQNKISSLKKEVSDLKVSKETLQKGSSAHDATLSSAQNQLTESLKQSDALKAQVEELATRNNLLTAELDVNRSDLEKLQGESARLQSLEARYHELETLLVNKAEENNSLSLELLALKNNESHLLELEGKLKTKDVQLLHLKSELERFHHDHAILAAAEKEKEAKLYQASNEVARLSAALKHMESEKPKEDHKSHNLLLDENSSLKQQNAKFSQELISLRTLVSSLEEEKANFSVLPAPPSPRTPVHPTRAPSPLTDDSDNGESTVISMPDPSASTPLFPASPSRGADRSFTQGAQNLLRFISIHSRERVGLSGEKLYFIIVHILLVLLLLAFIFFC